MGFTGFPSTVLNFITKNLYRYPFAKWRGAAHMETDSCTGCHETLSRPRPSDVPPRLGALGDGACPAWLGGVRTLAGQSVLGGPLCRGRAICRLDSDRQTKGLRQSGGHLVGQCSHLAARDAAGRFGGSQTQTQRFGIDHAVAQPRRRHAGLVTRC